MSNIVCHDGGLSLDQLQTNLRFAEAAKGQLTKIEGKDGATFSTHHAPTRVPVDSLLLVRDPNGNAPAPASSTLSCKGSSYVSRQSAAVTVFRKS